MDRTRKFGKTPVATSRRGGETRVRNADRAQGAWVTYQFKLHGVTQSEVAKTAGVTQQMVQRVAYGASTSARVQRAIANALGYASWSDVVAVRQAVAA